jgi:hypothetical protein
MAFPVAPTNGQETTVNGITYTFSSSNNAWTRKPRQLFTTGVNVPTNPAAGDQWYDTSEDILYQYINDGTTSYWVDIRSGIFGGNYATLGETLISGNLTPTTNVTYSLGNITHQWKDLYVSSNTIYIGGTGLSVQNGALQLGGSPLVTYANTDAAAYLQSGSLTNFLAAGITNSDPISYNAKTITANTTIANTYNAVSGGPITIANNVVVTIADGAVWSIV